MPNIIRNPAGSGAELQLENLVVDDTDYLREISLAGLVFSSVMTLDPDTVVQLRIPLLRPVLEMTSRVAWCRPERDCFVVGVEFHNKIDCFHARMVQQVCHIEHYRKTVRENEGRELSRQEAALEWIRNYAHDFPGPEDFCTE
ncbi:MAG: PilZ domain-containing protein [Acidiferrobacterales bacterium]